VLKAIEAAKKSGKPSLIECKTQIGFGAPNKQGKASAHGEPLGKDEVLALKKNLGLPEAEFNVDDDVYAYCKAVGDNGAKAEREWEAMMERYKPEYPDLYLQWQAWQNGELPDLMNNEDFWTCGENLATRVAGEQQLNKVAKLVPNLIGGAADLAPSTKTIMKDRPYYSKETPDGSNLHFGIRELAMTAIANGMALHGGLRPYIAGFFVFSDYMKPALRLEALMGIPVISILTHDSIGVGEDGPTHQPIEQLAALRSIPGYTVLRPCDANEVAAAWYIALNRKGPSAMTLSRQNLTTVTKTGKDALRGGYVLRDSKDPKVILIASGSEVGVAVAAYDLLAAKGVEARVVSMLSMEVFDEQSDDYKESVLPKKIRARVGIEAASEFGWHKYVGLDGKLVCMKGFGASAPFEKLYEAFGFTAENIANAAMETLK